MKLSHAPKIVDMFVGKFGYQEGALTGIGILELVCVALYVVPRTAVLGAILLCTYLGGAVATHVRVADNFLPPVVLGVIAWLGIYLREPRLQALVPLRKPDGG
jgi:xanthine/uracil permease